MLEEYAAPVVNLELNARNFYGVEMPADMLKSRLDENAAEKADTWVTVPYTRINPAFVGKVSLRGAITYTNNVLDVYDCHDPAGGRWRLYVLPQTDIVTLQQLPTEPEPV